MKIVEYANNWLIGTAHAQGRGSWNWETFNIIQVQNYTSTDSLLTRLISIFLTIVALVAFIMFLVYGFQYITAGGDGDKATKARTGIVNAVIGIVIVMAAYIILRVAVDLGGRLN